MLAHLLDVAAVAERMLAHEPASTLDWAAHALGLEREQVARWVACLVGLHDFGKAIPGFQDKWREGRQACPRASGDEAADWDWQMPDSEVFPSPAGMSSWCNDAPAMRPAHRVQSSLSST